MASQATGMVGTVLAMPLSATATWTAGKPLAGPTRRNWRSLILSFLAANVPIDQMKPTISRATAASALPADLQ